MLIMRTTKEPKAGPTRIPIRGVRLRCTPPKSGILTWKTANAAAVQNAASVILRLSIFFIDLTQKRAEDIRTTATAHQTITQNTVNDPSSRCMCAMVNPPPYYVLQALCTT
jgi:hypothetical protein